jgi:hypothetical protein
MGVVMNKISSVETFISSSPAEKADVLLRLAHELTIIARDTYDQESDGVTNPSRLRSINEIQHRTIGFVLALMTNNPNRYPDDVLVQIILDHPEDAELQRQLQEEMDRILSHAVPA